MGIRDWEIQASPSPQSPVTSHQSPFPDVLHLTEKGYIKQFLLNVSPKALRLPLRFYYWKLTGKHEKELLRLSELVGDCKRAIDVGGNNGLYTYALSQLCQVVEAFEPQSWCAQNILDYASSKENIRVHNVALSDEKGSFTLSIPILNGKLRTGLASLGQFGGETKKIQVPVHRLDDYNFQDVSFIKIDVEGYEINVIQGGKETILREKPVILAEIIGSNDQ